jgi:hypothetical protein
MPKLAFVDELDALNQNASMARYVMEKDRHAPPQ